MIKILDYSKLKEQIFKREQSTVDVSSIVKEILENVSKKGDEALYEYAEKCNFNLSKIYKVIQVNGFPVI